MAIDIKRALSTSFAGKQSYIALALGTVIMLPYAWSETQPASPGWVSALGVIGVVLLAAYQLLVMRAQFDSKNSAEPPALPAWHSDPASMIWGVLGLALIAVLMCVVFFAVMLGLMTPLLGFLLSSDDFGSLVVGSDPAHLFGRASIATSVAEFLVLAPLAMFGFVMVTHFACQGRIRALFQFRTIASVMFHRFWSLLAVVVLSCLGQLIFEALTSAIFPLYAFVEFVGSVIMSNLLAQVYIAQRFPAQPISQA